MWSEACCVIAQVTCVYLFHELPAAVRRKAAAEMARVCKPGGMVVSIGVDLRKLGIACQASPSWETTSLVYALCCLLLLTKHYILSIFQGCSVASVLQVLTDSVQLGDREAFDPSLGQFGEAAFECTSSGGLNYRLRPLWMRVSAHSW